MTRRPLVQNRDVALVGALVCLGGFWVLLYDATANHGRDQPWWIRWATWW